MSDLGPYIVFVFNNLYLWHTLGTLLALFFRHAKDIFLGRKSRKRILAYIDRESEPVNK